MKDQHEITIFKFAYAALTGFGDLAEVLYNRDKTILNAYGIDDAFVARIKDKTHELRIFPPDIDLLGDESDKCEMADNDAENIRVAIREIMGRVIGVFPEGSAKWIRFGTKGMDELTHLQLILCAENVAAKTTLYMDELDVKGVTPAMVTNLNDLITKLINSNSIADEAKRERRAKTRERVELGNEIYFLINEMFSNGKNYWVSRNEVYYKDYVIYNTPSGGPELSGKVGSIRGVMLDTYSSLPPMEGVVSLEFVDKDISINEDGSFQLNSVPVECTQLWGTALAHKTFYRKIEIQENKETDVEIRMEPGADNPPPPNN
jgi:hypothetical protein